MVQNGGLGLPSANCSCPQASLADYVIVLEVSMNCYKSLIWHPVVLKFLRMSYQDVLVHFVGEFVCLRLCMGGAPIGAGGT